MLEIITWLCYVIAVFCYTKVWRLESRIADVQRGGVVGKGLALFRLAIVRARKGKPLPYIAHAI
jgi:hypothetical protein